MQPTAPEPTDLTDPSGFDLDVLTHQVRDKVGCMVSIARMLADGLAGPTTPVQQGFCEQIEDVGKHLAPLLVELARRARRPTVS
jgi:hypothetical protein